MSQTPFPVQIAVIVATARACGLLLRWLGQPAVIGEMAAGLLLGPIALGAAFPEFHAQLFSSASLAGLSALSTLGLVLFMFLVGTEVRVAQGVLVQLKSAGAVGVLSMLFPAGLGLAVAPQLHRTLAPPGVSFWPFALFIAASMSVTAFPVMARILKDRRLTHTPLGQLSLNSAAFADVLAWVLLAITLAVVGAKDGQVSLVRIMVGLPLFAAFVFCVLKPALARLMQSRAPYEPPSDALLVTIVVCLLLCAAVSEWLNLHAVFGAFLFGTCLPRDERFLRALTERLEPVTALVLMPIFFALAGLSTTPNGLNASGVSMLGLILVAAVAGKVIGGTAGARISGFGWRDSLATGALMNARGLMELIVLKVGLDAGLIGPELFTLLLIMALVTTGMTGPLILLLSGTRHIEAAGVNRPGI
jgi:Kef-type K+ transport system membrane component KefB